MLYVTLHVQNAEKESQKPRPHCPPKIDASQELVFDYLSNPLRNPAHESMRCVNVEVCGVGNHGAHCGAGCCLNVVGARIVMVGRRKRRSQIGLRQLMFFTKAGEERVSEKRKDCHDNAKVPNVEPNVRWWLL